MSSDSPSTVGEPRHLYEIARLRLARMQLHGGASLGEVLAQATELAANTLDVARVGVWLFVDERRALRCFHLYERPAGAHSEGAILHAADFPSYFRALAERRHIAAEHARSDPMTRELAPAYLEPLGIVSMLDAPLYREGHVFGVVCHEHAGPLARQWTQHERDFAASVADSVAMQFEGAARQDAEASLKSVQSYLLEHQRMEAVGRLASGIARDFDSLLQEILRHARAIAESPSAAPPQIAEARQIVAAAERGGALARELGSFGPDIRRSTRVVAVTDVVQQMAGMLEAAVGPSCTVRLTRGPAAGRVMIDATQLERVVLNLAVNARDAMPGGGTITIDVNEANVPSGGATPGVYVVLEVADGGLGMDPATMTRMFEPFFTTKTETKSGGLGLTLVSQIVHHAGGFIHVDSAPGRGTRLRVYLPRVAAEA